MNILAKITGIRYTPYLCRNLKTYDITQIDLALSNDSSFLLNADKNKKIALSWWVSPKRTRSYPYARVYDTLFFHGKKVTIIPIFKDEGENGDRDFLQWDTISLMSLLGVYVIIGYYKTAKKNKNYQNKITEQRFDTQYLKKKIYEILSYQSDALHWNLHQIDEIEKISQKALKCYKIIEKKTGVKLHSIDFVQWRIKEIFKSKKNFMNFSRELAQKAQTREKNTIQPKENLSGTKATITIKNYLGGYYFFTCDEAKIEKNKIYLIEGKHTKRGIIPSTEDIKDGLIKIILFSNLSEVKFNNKIFSPITILKLTSSIKFNNKDLSISNLKILKLLKKEAEENNFEITLNNVNLKRYSL